MKLILMPLKPFLSCSNGHTPFLLMCNSRKLKSSASGLLRKFFVKKVQGKSILSFLYLLMVVIFIKENI